MKSWFSAAELAMLSSAGVTKIARSPRRAGESALKRGWLHRQVLGKGGKGGLKTEYNPPSETIDVIHAFLKANPDFFSEDKNTTSTQKVIKHYEKYDKATSLKLKTPEAAFVQDGLDPLLMHHVIVSVEKMLKKHGKELDATKKADLFFLIYDYSKAAGGMDEEMVERFVNVAG
ncbi:MAG: hypothetical protein JNL77_01855 [Nitrosomonas sp.]|nr:hypothetical protein [Nitrosomonas sp.]